MSLTPASFVDLFEVQAARSPESTAVIDRVRRLTYAELNGRANQIAHALRRLGAGREMLVGIFLQRSVELVAGLLGILKSGAAYVPLDPSYPSERICRIMSDSSPAVLLTQQSLYPKLRDFSGSLLCIETTTQEKKNWEAVPSPVTSRNLAYVIYTSGSTGKPKGVEIMHSSVINLLSALVEEWNITAEDSFLAAASVAFDMSVPEIFVPLVRGARLRIVESPFIERDNFLKALCDPEITFVQGTSSTWRMALDSGWKGNRKLKAVCGGEALSLELARALTEKVGTLWNMYGPTETCVWSTACRINRSDSKVTLGHPLSGTQLYVLDQDEKPVGPGAAGELYVGGAGLARGYRGDADLTSQKFVSNSFSDSRESRLYRTGDRVLFHDNGSLEFMDRMDLQVKVRGFRVETGDVEAAVMRHEAIKGAAVAVRQDGTGSNLLIAYLVARTGVPPSIDELRAFLREILPEYMVPSLFMFLKALPVTPNGKLDRNALLHLKPFSSETEREFAHPSGWIQETLAGIWSDVLGVDRPGVYDNFFDLGGHSLSATQVQARIRHAFDLEIPFSTFFQAPTILALSKHLAHAVSAAHSLPEIKKISRQLEIPLSFPQEGVWFLQQLTPECNAYHFQSKLQFDGNLNLESLRQSLAEIVRRHEIYRTSFPSLQGRPVQQIHEPWIPDLPVVDLSGEPDQESAAEHFIQVTVRSIQFDVAQLPLIRWFVLHLSSKRNILLHIEHHLVHDGWSFRVFLNELITLYLAYNQELASPLPELNIQFADFAWWQQNILKEILEREQLPYWKKKLSGAQTLIELPSDRSRLKRQRYRGAAPRIELPERLYKSLCRMARENSTTLFVTMLAALLALIYRYTAQEDLVVGTGIANRRTRETESMIGMVINTVVLRTDLSGNPTFRELLDRGRKVILEAQEHQDLPFRAIVESLQPERQLQANPLFQVMFNFHDAPLRLPEIPGTEITLTEVISNDSAKFDLNLIVIPPVKTMKGCEAINLIWEYSTDLFEPATIRRMMNHYVQILEGAVANPGSRISDLPIMTEAERTQIRADWNKTATDYPREKTISESPDCERPEMTRPYVEPQNEIEEVVARIWSEVLDRNRIGVQDDFFELGGDSISAIRVVSRLYTALGIQIPISLIFEISTVSGLTDFIQNRIEPLPTARSGNPMEPGSNQSS